MKPGEAEAASKVARALLKVRNRENDLTAAQTDLRIAEKRYYDLLTGVSLNVGEVPALKPEQPDPTARARIAYAAYGRMTGNKNFRGEPMPEFDALPENIQHAWIAAAAAVTCDHV